jgi:site-specific recombinase XerD
VINSIDVTTLVGLRDRALIGIMAYSFARVSAVVSMRVKAAPFSSVRAQMSLDQ